MNLHELYCEVTVRGGIEQVILVSNATETFQDRVWCLDCFFLSWIIYRTCTIFLLGLHIIIDIEKKGEG